MLLPVAYARKRILLARRLATGYTVPMNASVDLPEGNFTVALEIESDAPTAVYTCSRRVLAFSNSTARRRLTIEATVNVRSPGLSDGGRVTLNERETRFINWQSRLALECPGAEIRSLRVEPDPGATTIFLAGDSTVVDQEYEPWAAWGQLLPMHFGPGIAIANYAESGESLASFVAEGRLRKIEETIRAGDYLFVQFAHNDQKPGPWHSDAARTFPALLRRFIETARTHEARPVLVTPMLRRRFDADGRVIDTLEGYPDAMRLVAERESVALIDLNEASRTLYETLGPERSKTLFVHYAANTFPGQPQALADDSHFSVYGASQLAAFITTRTAELLPGLRGFLRNTDRVYDPRVPDDPDAWRVPRSSTFEPYRPLGDGQ